MIYCVRIYNARDLDRGGVDGDVASAGLSSAEHPLLGASIPVAEGDSFVFTGRLSLASHAWLAGHAVFGAVVLPGTAFVELALAAAERVGLGTIEALDNERTRAFEGLDEERPFEFRVVPQRFAAYLAVQMKGDYSSFGPQDFLEENPDKPACPRVAREKSPIIFQKD